MQARLASYDTPEVLLTHSCSLAKGPRKSPAGPRSVELSSVFLPQPAEGAPRDTTCCGKLVRLAAVRQHRALTAQRAARFDSVAADDTPRASVSCRAISRTVD